MKILITAGPTREALDPVRYLGNRSSGKMGYALAKAAVQKGWECYLISGPVDLPWPEAMAGEKVESAQEMFDAVERQRENQDVIVMCAAVADYKPREILQNKKKKSSNNWQVELVRTKDILKHVGHNKKKSQLVVGFCLETENLLESAKKKLDSKKADVILANPASTLDADAVTLSWLDVSGRKQQWQEGQKEDVAVKVIEALQNYCESRQHV